MYYGNIKPFSVENGPGVRVSLFVSGCTHKCQGCFSADTWNFQFGQPFTDETQQEIISMLAPDYIAGLTLLGGDPTEPVNQKGLLPLLRTVKQKYPEKDVWVYSGYWYEDFAEGGRAYCEATEEFLDCCDVMVDGPFLASKKNLLLSYRGSENQRIIDVKKTKESGRIVELNFDSADRIKNETNKK